MIEDYRQRWRSAHRSGLVLSGKLLLATSEGGDAERLWQAQLQRAAGGGAPAKSLF
ncbi:MULTISPECIES: hypothetical protein [unclassified Sphingomonas]|uniref:hypothetical protein n=1 Tax=unclassified Sphingomonas TaxID=196159 RepID=UPI000AB3EC84|nr:MULTISPECIES: hypothetical protein [unclassified Sphingomonas]MBD8550284.1 hypothetical protein [Sphingomonas sp. CFBP 8764]